MEASVPSDYMENKLPLLNCKVWLEKTEDGQQIRYEHYEKPMASILEIQEESAMPGKIKRATLVQGGITRLLNTSIELGKVKQDEILSKYMKKLQSSGYDAKTRIEILKSITNGWKEILRKSESGERPLHRSRGYKKEERKEAKLMKRVNWYKGKDQKSFDSFLMIPATPGSELKRSFEEQAAKEGLKIRIVEKAGMKLGSYFKKFDKTQNNQTCGDKDFLVCKNSTKKNTKCRIPNIVYKIACIAC